MINMGKMVTENVLRALDQYEAKYRAQMSKPNIEITTDAVRMLLNESYRMACMSYVESLTKSRGE